MVEAIKKAEFEEIRSEIAVMVDLRDQAMRLAAKDPEWREIVEGYTLIIGKLKHKIMREIYEQAD